jgi:hypothetical protein
MEGGRRDEATDESYLVGLRRKDTVDKEDVNGQEHLGLPQGAGG